MTREEAITKVEKIDGHPYSQGSVDAQEIVDEIYDDLESRTCENCSHSSDIGWCEIIDIGVNTDFGCNEFERKQND